MRPCGLMDKAPDFGSGDCRFESCHGRKYILFLYYIKLFLSLSKLHRYYLGSGIKMGFENCKETIKLDYTDVVNSITF